MAIEVWGKDPVYGEIKIQGSKNAVLPIMAASVLAEGVSVIENCPDILDVRAMADVLKSIGAKVDFSENTLRLDTSFVDRYLIEEERVGEIRASILLLGSVLAKFHRAQIEYPGGCSIGKRPVDFHFQAFQKMGVITRESEGRIYCEAGNGLTGAEIELPFPSVGATENILLSSVLAKGETVLHGAALEPEIAELCQFLSAMGADIRGIGTDIIRIRGVKKLYPVHWRLCSDRIVFLTWAMLTAGCGGEACLYMPEAIPSAEWKVLEQMGCEVRRDHEKVCILQRRAPRAVSYLKTRPYPGYPTDGQSLIMPVLCKGNGVSTIEEGIFENRFRMIRQLKKMGANIDYVCNRARITGVTKLHGAEVKADDLRSGAGLLIAAAMAEGKSTILQENFIRRGYENVTGQMRALGIRAKEEDAKERN